MKNLIPVFMFLMIFQTSGSTAAGQILDIKLAGDFIIQTISEQKL